MLIVAASDASRGDATFLDELRRIPRRWACVIGLGGPVTDPEVRDACDLRVAIRLARTMVSGRAGASRLLSPGVAASVYLNGLAERSRRSALEVA